MGNKRHGKRKQSAAKKAADKAEAMRNLQEPNEEPKKQPLNNGKQPLMETPGSEEIPDSEPEDNPPYFSKAGDQAGASSKEGSASQAGSASKGVSASKKGSSRSTRKRGAGDPRSGLDLDTFARDPAATTEEARTGRLPSEPGKIAGWTGVDNIEQVNPELMQQAETLLRSSLDFSKTVALTEHELQLTDHELQLIAVGIKGLNQTLLKQTQTAGGVVPSWLINYCALKMGVGASGTISAHLGRNASNEHAPEAMAVWDDDNESGRLTLCCCPSCVTNIVRNMVRDFLRSGIAQRLGIPGMSWDLRVESVFDKIEQKEPQLLMLGETYGKCAPITGARGSADKLQLKQITPCTTTKRTGQILVEQGQHCHGVETLARCPEGVWLRSMAFAVPHMQDLGASSGLGERDVLLEGFQAGSNLLAAAGIGAALRRVIALANLAPRRKEVVFVTTFGKDEMNLVDLEKKDDTMTVLQACEATARDMEARNPWNWLYTDLENGKPGIKRTWTLVTVGNNLPIEEGVHFTGQEALDKLLTGKDDCLPPNAKAFRGATRTLFQLIAGYDGLYFYRLKDVRHPLLLWGKKRMSFFPVNGTGTPSTSSTTTWHPLGDNLLMKRCACGSLITAPPRSYRRCGLGGKNEEGVSLLYQYQNGQYGCDCGKTADFGEAPVKHVKPGQPAQSAGRNKSTANVFGTHPLFGEQLRRNCARG